MDHRRRSDRLHHPCDRFGIPQLDGPAVANRNDFRFWRFFGKQSAERRPNKSGRPFYQYPVPMSGLRRNSALRRKMRAA
jgi:hypothetical protein